MPCIQRKENGSTCTVLIIKISAFEDDDDEDDLEEQEADDEFGEMHGMGAARLVTTVPAKEPAMDAQPLKSALKKAGRGSRDPSSSPPSRQGTR